MQLGILPPIGGLLAVDWAPAEREGDKLLFVFDGGVLSRAWQQAIVLQPDELSSWRFVDVSDLEAFLAPRLSRRIGASIEARSLGRQAYLEHGVSPGIGGIVGAESAAATSQ